MTETSAADPSTPRLPLVLAQVSAIDAFNAARRSREHALQAGARSREMRLDTARSLDVLRRQHEAVVRRAHQHLVDSGELLGRRPLRRVVLAHRSPWFLDRVSRALADASVEVVAMTDNGADAVGIVVAEQPDVVLVEDTLLMVTGRDVVLQAREYAPRTLVAAQTGGSEGVGPLLAAGAVAVFTRQVPPAEVAQALLELTPG